MFIGMMASGVLFLAAILIAVGLAANAVWRAIAAPAGLPRSAGCGSCGYELTTLQAGRCSECGADLLKAGVNTRRNVIRTAGSVPAAMLGWSLIVISAGTIVIYMVSMVAMTQSVAMGAAGGAGGMAYTSNFTFRPSRLPPAADGTRQSPPSFTLAVDVDVDGNWGMPANSGTILFTISADEQEAVIAFNDASTDAWVLTGPDGVEIARGEYLAPEDVSAAFSAIGLEEAEHATLPDFAAEITNVADLALQDPLSYETNMMASAGVNANNSGAQLQQSGGTSNWGGMGAMMGSPSDYIIPIVTLGVCVLVWIGGIVFILRRRAKLLSEPRDAAAS